MAGMGSKTQLINNINMSAEENAKAYWVFSNVALTKGRPLVKLRTVFFCNFTTTNVGFHPSAYAFG